MAKILIETRLNSLKLNESKQPRKGCLGRIEGICADYGNPTRNGRFYSKELWENVFNDELVKESLESKTLIGELDHPEDRFEPLAKEACVTMTDYRFDDDKQVVYGGFDILDTPAGRILKSLVDYGCVMGVSSRGQGDIINTGDQEAVDPATYEFACFDVVTTPAVMSARQKVTEGLENKSKIKGLQASILEQVNNSTTNAELDTILRVVESTGISNLAKIKLAIRNKRKSIAEGKTISDNELVDLQKAKEQLEDENSNLKDTIDKTINESKNLSNSVSELSSQVIAYRYRESRLVSAFEKLKSDSKAEINHLTERLNHQKEVNADLFKDNDILSSHAEQLKTKISVLESHNKRLSDKTISFRKAIHESNTKINSVNDENSQLREEINNLKRNISLKESKVNELSEMITAKDSELDKLKAEKTKALNESMIKENKTNKLLEDYKNRYIESICSNYGVDSTEIKKFITPNISAESIESKIKSYVDRLDRYSSLPFSSSTPQSTIILSENLKSHDSELDEELENSRRFMESVAGVN